VKVDIVMGRTEKGHYTAHVRQDGVLGRNLLAEAKISKPETAKAAATRVLIYSLPRAAGTEVEIVWIEETPDA
jgi:hypothetical protein